MHENLLAAPSTVLHKQMVSKVLGFSSRKDIPTKMVDSTFVLVHAFRLVNCGLLGMNVDRGKRLHEGPQVVPVPVISGLHFNVDVCGSFISSHFKVADLFLLFLERNVAYVHVVCTIMDTIQQRLHLYHICSNQLFCFIMIRFNYLVIVHRSLHKCE